MDKINSKRRDEGLDGGVEGVVVKSADVELSTVTEEQLKLINKYTLEPLEAEDVFTFKVAVCDNEIDRDFEVFPTRALKRMKNLFVGKTMIKDHRRASDNQVARIFDTEIVSSETKTTGNGEPYNQLVAHSYMLKTDSNDSLIREIKGGIKKEVSVGVSVDKAVCSICGVDNTKDYCPHYWGQEYEGEKCFFKLAGISDAYEVSFVAVPAQPKAGVVKHYGAKFKSFDKQPAPDDQTEKQFDDETLKFRMRLLDQTLKERGI